jgi:glycosyltransferase involved in cell wall biosynthesis
MYYREDFDIPADCFLFIIASRAIHDKGWDIAIECISELNRLGRKSFLMLVGDGEYFKEISHQGDGKSFIKFLGYREDLESLLLLADMVIFPTSFPGESLPLFLISALHAKKPILSTNIGEIKNMMAASGDIAGELIECVGDKNTMVQQFVNSALRYIDDGDFYLHKTFIAEQAAKKFDMDVVLQQIYHIYATTISKQQLRSTHTQVSRR